MPKLIETHRRLKDQGLVLIGIHTTNGGEKMEAYAKEAGIDFPIAIDVDKKTTTAFAVDSYPDYYLIDRSGKLRVADIQNGDFERALEVLLAEPAPAAPKVAHLNAEGAAQLIGAKQPLTVLDIRTQREVDAGYIAGAKHIDFMQESFRDEASKLDRSTPVLVYCASGGRSTRSLTLLQELGFDAIYHLDGGFRGWSAAGLPAAKPEKK